MKNKKVKIIPLLMTLMLCSCGVEKKDYSSSVSEGDERVTLAQLITPGSEGNSEDPYNGEMAGVSGTLEAVYTPTPTPIPAVIPYNIRTNLAPSLISAKGAGDSQKTEAVLGQIWDEDPAWADKFRAVTEHWDKVNAEGYVNVFTDTEYIRDDVIQNGMKTTAFNGRLMFPEKLPEDESLCFIVAGFELQSNGAPKKEMIDRLVIALGCAQQYPNSYVLLTGGPTAMGNPSATEADVMADWLEDHGVSRERLIVENRSTITFENALFAYDILQKEYPQIAELAIVSSDYHIPLCSILFEARCLLKADEDSTIHVIANIGSITTGYSFGIKEQGRQLTDMIREIR